MVYILLAPGFEEAEALVPADLLRRAKIETALVSITGEPVPGSHGVTVTADTDLDGADLSRAEMIVLPGGGPGHKNLGAEPRVERLVREAADRGLWVAAICAAPAVLLAPLGILDGKKATCWAGGAFWRESRPSATPAWRRASPAPRSGRPPAWSGTERSSPGGPPAPPSTSGWP